ncbi:unnamed protein product [Peronospora belbahrii]|uniref:Uncharacterized protein n=1 Tax=Peronospora belbahrii TaxID=622444 RepID=A0ABN8D7R2_9STRA|nr:unnamed protein product [Peronospora belbahrii]
MIQENTVRLLIPSLVYRMTRCEPKDIDVLKHFLEYLNLYVTRPRKSSKYRSHLLYYVIIFSELWEKPTPSIEELTLRFKSVRITNGEMQQFVQLYCAFSKEKSSGCDQSNVENYLSDAITYNPNDYRNEKATIPAHASVLWLQSKLEMSLPAEALREQLDGDKKELLRLSTPLVLY